MIILDTHIWFYYINNGVEALSENIQKAIADNEILGISIISCWEIAMLVARERIKLSIDVQDWIITALSYKGFKLIDLTPEIAILSTRLPGEIHKDPADRMIVSSCIKHKAPLCTYDQKIIDWGHVRTIS